MSPATLFWDVDTQADFIYPGGKLYVPGAESIVPALGALTAYAAENGIMIVASADAHHPDDAELATYPPHCMVGTPGQQKIPETLVQDAVIVPNRPVMPLNIRGHRQIVIEKQALDVFSNPNIEVVLDQLAPIRDIVLYGVVTELCVAFAARGLIRRGYRLRIVADAIRHLDQGQAKAFLDEAARLGAAIVPSREVLGELARLHA